MGTSVYKEVTTWSAQPVLPATRDSMSYGQNGYNYSMIGFCGIETATRKVTLLVYNMTSWSTPASSSGTARTDGAGGLLNNNIYFSGGWDGAATYAGNEKYNGSAIASYTDPGYPTFYGSASRLKTQEKLYYVCGITSVGSGAATSLVRQMNSAESASAGTSPSGPRGRHGLGELFGKLYLYCGFTNTGAAQPTSVNESFNGTSWTTEVVSPSILSYVSEYASSTKIGALTGYNSGTVAQNTNQQYNGTSWSLGVVYPMTASALNSGGF